MAAITKTGQITDILGTTSLDNYTLLKPKGWANNFGHYTLSVTLLAGNDKLNIIGDTSVNATPIELTIDTGTGNDIVTINKLKLGNLGLSLFAGEGNDTISIKNTTGKIDIDGGAGNDLIYTNLTSGPITINAGAGNDVVTVTNATGASSTVSISGSDGNDALTGSNMRDIIHGDTGNDTLIGGGGDDDLYGDEGNDIISGVSGNNNIYGGKGNDSLIAGKGRDIFFYEEGDGLDTILYYGLATDSIKISGSYTAESTTFTYVSGSTHIRFDSTGTEGIILLGVRVTAANYASYGISFEGGTILRDGNENVTLLEDTVKTGNLLLNATDPNNGVLSIAEFSIAGNSTVFTAGQTAILNGVGTLEILSNGDYSFTPNSNYNGAVPVVTYTVSSSPGETDTSTLTLNVTPVNDAAVLSHAVVNLVETNAIQTTSGTLAISDIDSPATFVARANVVGLYGRFSINTSGNWTYTMSSAHNQFVEGGSYTDSFTVSAADGTTTTVVVNILGTNDAAVVSSATVNLTEKNAILTTTGKLSISDVDSTSNFVAQSNVAGLYGTFNINAAGNWSYVTTSAHNEFAANQIYTETFTVSSVDGTLTTVKVNIKGTNDLAVLSSAVINLLETNSILSTSGVLTLTDVDSATAFVARTNVSGLYGKFSIDVSGNWSYVTNTANDGFVAGRTYTDVFTVKSSDGGTTTVRVNILGTNEAAILSSATVNLTETDAILMANGVLTITDVDGLARFIAQSNVSGLYGKFSINALGSWNYISATAHNEFVEGMMYTDTFVVSAADGTTTTVTVNILGTNDAAVLSSETRNLVETHSVLTANGALTISDVDSPALFLAQTNVLGSYGFFTINAAGVWNYTTTSAHDEFVAGQTYTDTFIVSATDGTTSSVTIHILGTQDSVVISSQTQNLVEADSSLSANGLLSIDGSSSAVFVGQNGVAGVYGTFSIDSSGNWTYTTTSAHNEFVAGQTYTDTFTVTSSQGGTGTVTIHILGTDDASVITGTSTVTLVETNVAQSASGVLTATDSDSSALFNVLTNAAGTNGYGRFSIDTAGNWTYTMDSAHDEFAVGQTYTDSITVSTTDGTTQLITITMTGTDDATVITGTSTATLVESNLAQTATGTLTAFDPDSSPLFTVLTNAAGNNGYGKFSIDAQGHWTYTMGSAHDEFVAGQTYTDSIIVTTADGTTQLITVTMTGTDDATVITGTSTTTLTETNLAQSASGTLIAIDPDSSALFTVLSNVEGSNGFGTFSIDATGHWTYTMGSAHDEFISGQSYTDSITVITTDGTAQIITVTMTGTDDATMITGTSTATLTETSVAQSASGNLTATDPDSSALFTVLTNVAGTNGFGKFSIDAAGHWTYTMDSAHDEFAAGSIHTDSITVTTADGSAQVITITIIGTNDAAVLSADIKNLTETNAILTTSGTLTVSDIDSAQSFVAQTNSVGLYGLFSINEAGNWTYSTTTPHDEFIVGQTYTEIFIVSAADGTTTTVTINILGSDEVVNVSPVIASNGGGDMASISIPENRGAVTVIAALDSDGDTLTYSIVGGTDAALFRIDPLTGMLAFIQAPNYELLLDASNPKDNIYEVVIQVSDGAGGTDTQTIAVNVTNVPEASKVFLVTATTSIATYMVNEDTSLIPLDTSASLSVASQNAITMADINGDGKVDILAAANSNIYKALGDGTGVFGAFTSTFLSADSVNSLVVGDFNNDSLLDVVVAGSGSQLKIVTPQVNNGPIGTIAGFSTSTGVRAADFNNDGNLDLLTINTGARVVSVMLGNGNLTFEAPKTYSSGTDVPRGVAISDFNSDNILDFAMTTTSIPGSTTTTPGTVALFYGKGDGTFIAGTKTLVGIQPAYLLTADFNGDGKMDLLVNHQTIGTITDPLEHKVSVLISNGDGTFFTRDLVVAIPNTTNPSQYQILSSIGVADFNSDGKLDITVLSVNVIGSATANFASFFLGNGDGTFGNIITSSTPLASGGYLAIGQNTTQAPVITTNGGGESANIDLAEHTLAVSTIQATDVDSSSLSYSIVGGLDASLFAIDATTGALSFIQAPSYLFPNPSLHSNAYHVMVAASDSTGNRDVQELYITIQNASIPVQNLDPTITSNGGTSAASVMIAENTTAVTTVMATDLDSLYLSYAIVGGADAALFQINPTTGVLSFITAPDFENPLDAAHENLYEVQVQVSDGVGGVDRQDLSVAVYNISADVLTGQFFVTANSDSISVLRLGTDGQLAAPTHINIGATPAAILAADFNRDGFVDLFVARNDTGTLNDTLSLFLGNATGFASTASYTFAVSNPTALGVGNFNGDGFLDISVSQQDQITNANTIALMSGNGGTGFTLIATTPVNGSSHTIDDFNLDGKDDLVVVNSDLDSISIYMATGSGTFAAPVTYVTGNSPETVITKDFNADSMTDLVVTNYGSGTISILLANADGTFQNAVNYDIGAQPTAVVAGDFNNDGNMDLAITNNGSNRVSVLLGLANGGFGTTSEFLAGAVGSNLGGLLVADANRDGKTDLLVTDSNSNAVSILMGQGDGTFSSPAEYTAGTLPGLISTNQSNLAITTNGGGDLGTIALLDHTLTVTKVIAKSALHSSARYSITGGLDASLFVIDPLTGVLSFIQAPSFLHPNSAANTNTYDVIVKATDSYNGSDTQHLSVMIQDQGITVQNYAPVISSNGGGDTATIHIKEWFNNPTKVVATDSDSLYITYSITGPDASLFTINPTNGDLTFNTRPIYLYPIDSDRDGTYNVTVRAFDGLVYDMQDLSIKVDLDPNQSISNAFFITGSYLYKVYFNSFYGSGTRVAVPVNPEFTGDFNGDGRTDLASGGSVYYGTGLGTFGAANNITSGRNIVAVSDVNGDGISDLMVQNGGVTGGIEVVLGQANKTLPILPTYNLIVPNSQDNRSLKNVVMTDINNDGKQDMILLSTNASQGSNDVSVYLGNGDGTFQFSNWAGKIASGTVAPKITSGDFNSDGNSDLALILPTGQLSLIMGDGTGILGPQTNTSITNARYMVTDDFNRDGRADLAVATSTGVYMLLGQANGTFLSNQISTFVGADINIADFNRDGTPDLILRGASIIFNYPDAVYIIYMNNQGGVLQQFTDGTSTMVGGGNVTTGTYLTSIVSNLRETNAVLMTQGDLTPSDAFNPILFFAKTASGSYGNFSITSDGAWTYTANSAYNELASGVMYTDTFYVTSTENIFTTVTVNIIGTNDLAVFTTIASPGHLKEDATLSTTGQILIASDIDGPTVWSSASAGLYGTLVFNDFNTGAYTYTLNNNNAAVQALTAGQTLTDTITLTSAAGNESTTVTFIIDGTNDATIIGTPSAITPVKEDGQLTSSGTVPIIYADPGQGFFIPSNIQGLYGVLTIAANGQYQYTLNSASVQFLRASDSLTDNITVQTLDGTSRVLSFRIEGTNDVSAISLVSGSTFNVIEDSSVAATGGAIVSDIDTNQNTFSSASAGLYGTFSLNLATGDYSYVVNNTLAAVQALRAGQQLTDTVTITSLDGTATMPITFTITGVNDAAVIGTPTVNTVKEDTTLTASGTLSISDPDSGQNSFIAFSNKAGTYGSLTLSTNGNYTYTLSNASAAVQAIGESDTKIDSFTVSALDGTTKVIHFNIQGTNDGVVITSTTPSYTRGEGINTPIVFTATDKDSNAVLSYSISGIDAARFMLDVNHNVVFKNTPNFENPLDAGRDNIYDIFLDVSDGIVKASQAVTVKVTNIDNTIYVGSINGSAVTINGTSGDDFFSLRPSLNGTTVLTVRGNGGDDTFSMENSTALDFRTNPPTSGLTLHIQGDGVNDILDLSSINTRVGLAAGNTLDLDPITFVFQVGVANAFMPTFVAHYFVDIGGGYKEYRAIPQAYYRDESTYSNLTGLIGTLGDDTFYTAGIKGGSIAGGFGNDIIFGNSYGEVLTGGYGRDDDAYSPYNSLIRNSPLSDNDTIFGGGGADTIIAGYGRDQIYLHTTGVLSTVPLTPIDVKNTVIFNENTFGYQYPAQYGTTIHYFQRGIDKIDLSGIDANVDSLAGDQAFTFGYIDDTRFTSVPAYSVLVSLWHSYGDGHNSLNVYINANGDDVADMVIHFNDIITPASSFTLTANDFIL